MTKEEILLRSILGNQAVILAALGTLVSNQLKNNILDQAEKAAKTARDGFME